MARSASLKVRGRRPVTPQHVPHVPQHDPNIWYRHPRAVPGAQTPERLQQVLRTIRRNQARPMMPPSMLGILHGWPPPGAPLSAFSRWGSVCYHVEPGVSRCIPSTPLPRRSGHCGGGAVTYTRVLP